MFEQLREEVYQMMSALSASHKHARELDRQQLTRLNDCLDLIELLESKLTTCRLMQSKKDDLVTVHKETIEFPE